MFVSDLDHKLARLISNNSCCHSLRIIYSIITGATLVTEEGFLTWFTTKVEQLRLVENIDYRYQGESINSVRVKGHVGFMMIALEDNESGNYARNFHQRRRAEFDAMIMGL